MLIDDVYMLHLPCLHGTRSAACIPGLTHGSRLSSKSYSQSGLAASAQPLGLPFNQIAPKRDVKA